MAVAVLVLASPLSNAQENGGVKKFQVDRFDDNSLNRNLWYPSSDGSYGRVVESKKKLLYYSTKWGNSHLSLQWVKYKLLTTKNFSVQVTACLPKTLPPTQYASISLCLQTMRHDPLCEIGYYNHLAVVGGREIFNVCYPGFSMPLTAEHPARVQLKLAYTAGTQTVRAYYRFQSTDPWTQLGTEQDLTAHLNDEPDPSLIPYLFYRSGKAKLPADGAYYIDDFIIYR
jgi:hypothetical protein